MSSVSSVVERFIAQHGPRARVQHETGGVRAIIGAVPSGARERAEARRSRITVRRYATAAEADRDDLAFWQKLSDAERILQVWRLSEEMWRLRGEFHDEPGLCRSIARVRRG